MSNDKTQTKTNTATDQGIGSLQIQQLFKVMVDNGASDLHLTVGSAPGMRISGDIVRVKIGTLTPDDSKRLIYQILTEKQKAELEKRGFNEKATKFELRQFRYIKFINQKWKKKCLLEQKPYIKHYAVH